jgi:hypothetical protein
MSLMFGGRMTVGAKIEQFWLIKARWRAKIYKFGGCNQNGNIFL